MNRYLLEDCLIFTLLIGLAVGYHLEAVFSAYAGNVAMEQFYLQIATVPVVLLMVRIMFQSMRKIMQILKEVE